MTLRLVPFVIVAAVAIAAGAQESDRATWDKLFSQKSYVFGTEAIPLLKEYVHTFRRGRALDLAMGEGRNAVFLAQQGFDVTGVDFSSTAITKARRLAEDRDVRLQTVQADLREYDIAADSYDVITNIYYPQRQLFDQIKAGLKPGGVFVFEQWHPYGWKTRRPPRAPLAPARPNVAELFQYSDMGLQELAGIFDGYQIVLYREAVVDQSIGGSPRGVMLTEVSSLIAKKPF